MAIVRNTLLVTASLAAPTVMMAPPFKTYPNEAVIAHRERMSLTQLGFAGKQLFTQRCAHCHGREAKGTNYGPSLQDEAYQNADLSGRRFHRTVTQGITARFWDYGDMPPQPGLSFNQIELIARYVREVRNPEYFR